MSKGSQVVCDKQMVLEVATMGIQWIKEKRISEREAVIQEAMKRKKFIWFGRNLNREEAIDYLRGDVWNTYHWVSSYYGDSEQLFKKLIGAISVSCNSKNILLSVSDANTIHKWSNI